MQSDTEFGFEILRVGNPRTEDMDFMAAADHFLDEIDRFRRTAPGRRIKRLMRQKRDAERRLGFAHAMTLCNFAAAIQSQFAFKRTAEALILKFGVPPLGGPKAA